MANAVNYCNADSKKETNNYGFKWTAFNESYSPNLANQYLYESFQYESAASLNSYPYGGVYNTYTGDGYVFKLIGSAQDLISNLAQLQLLQWIDRQTRAVFIEILFYNPNVDSFAYITILFEILPSGNLVNSIQIVPIKLFNDSSLLTILLTVYFVLTIFFIINEADRARKEGFRYLKYFWNWIEIAIVSFSIASYALSFNAYNDKNAALNFIKQTEGFSYLRLQGMSYSNQLLLICFSFALFFTTIKFIKIIRFSEKILYFIELFKTAANDLINYSFGFFVYWFAFVQLMYLMFNSEYSYFRSFANSMMTGFIMLVGYHLDEWTSFEMSVFHKFLISCYEVSVILLSMYLVVSILCEAFKKAKDNFVKMGKYNAINLFAVMKKRFKAFLHKPIQNEIETIPADKSTVEKFNEKANELINYLEKVFFIYIVSI